MIESALAAATSSFIINCLIDYYSADSVTWRPRWVVRGLLVISTKARKECGILPVLTEINAQKAGVF